MGEILIRTFRQRFQTRIRHAFLHRRGLERLSIEGNRDRTAGQQRFAPAGQHLCQQLFDAAAVGCVLHAVGQIAHDHVELLLAKGFAGDRGIGVHKAHGRGLLLLEVLRRIGEGELHAVGRLAALHGQRSALNGMLIAVIFQITLQELPLF